MLFKFIRRALHLYNITDSSRENSFKEEIFKEEQIFEEEKATDK